MTGLSAPMTVDEMMVLVDKLPEGSYVEYYCNVCGRRLTSKYGMVHADDETPECVIPTKYKFKFITPDIGVS